jgi:hypothetical protein
LILNIFANELSTIMNILKLLITDHDKGK